MKKKIHIYHFLLLFILLIFLIFFIYHDNFYHTKIITIKWSQKDFDANYKYGVYVYTGGVKNGKVEIKAKVYTNENNFLPHNLGVIGTSDSNNNDINLPDVVAQWGAIRWEPEGVYIGSGAGLYFISKEVLKGF
jgi:hypothetical protein